MILWRDFRGLVNLVGCSRGSRLAGMSVKLALEDTGTKFLTVPVG
jgi:hypothetical protein